MRLLYLGVPLAVLAIIPKAGVAAGLSGAQAPHNMGPVLLSLVVIIVAAKVGADLAARISQPPVLGELAVGLVIGNLVLFGFHGLDFIRTDVVVSALAEIGVILLLFEVGLQSNVNEMLRLGLSAFLVAALGVIAPFALGFGVARMAIPEQSVYVHVFIGATLCATSVGITARVFKDLGKLHLIEAKIILGAAVIDDVIGLVVVAIVQGIITAAAGANAISTLDVVGIVAKATAFLVGSVVIGQALSPILFRLASRLRGDGLLLGAALFICFSFAYLAAKIQLAPIVGAFAAGLILDEAHYRDLRDRGEHGLEDLLRPITSFLVPIFFVLMGIKVQLGEFGNLSTVGFASALALAAVIGKQICSLGAFGKGIDRILIGLGMIPRGEVGLIVAAIGAGMTFHGKHVVDERTFSAIVIVVMVTTFVTPPLLKWRMARRPAA